MKYKGTDLVIQQHSLLTRFRFERLEKFRDSEVVLVCILYLIRLDIFFDDCSSRGGSKEDMFIFSVHNDHTVSSCDIHGYGIYENELTTAEIHNVLGTCTSTSSSERCRFAIFRFWRSTLTSFLEKASLIWHCISSKSSYSKGSASSENLHTESVVGSTLARSRQYALTWKSKLGTFF